MIITAKNCWSKSTAKHKKYFDEYVDVQLKLKEKLLPPFIYDFLTNNHDLIRDGAEDDLRRLHAEYSTLQFRIDEENRKSVTEIILKIYDYDLFCDITTHRWSAYKLCEESNILTCPYCNLSYGHTISRLKKGGLRPSLDHFFDRATHPMFGISLNNLIPSCHNCNSSLKGSINFRKIPHLNPFIDAESIKITLDVTAEKGRVDLRLFDRAEILVEYDVDDPKCINSMKTFLLAERYKLLVSEARLIAKHMVTVSTGGNYDARHLEWALRGVSTSNYRDRVLGKMINDLAEKYLRKA